MASKEKLALPELVLRMRSGAPVLTDDALFEACGVRIAFTGREGGVSEGEFSSLNVGDYVGDDIEVVQANRQRVAQALGAGDAQLIVPKQVHGTDGIEISTLADLAHAREAAAVGADMVLVKELDVAALLCCADCLPLILVSPSGAFAVVHAGWRGALAGIAGKAAERLSRFDGTPTEHFNAYIGPHIRQECFETSEDVVASFGERFGTEVVDENRHVSLALVVMRDLERVGVLADRIVDACICTCCDSQRYFSFRAEDGRCGRQAFAAVRARLC